MSDINNNPDDYDSIESYIEDAMADGYTITADDFRGRPCAYCGDMISFSEWPDNVVIWDTEIVDMQTGEEEPYIKRDYFCSDQCKHDAMRDTEWLKDENGRRFDEGDRIHVDEVERRA